MKLTAVVDRIEEQYAVLLVGETEQSVNWPVALLPQPVREGDFLSVEWLLDAEKTATAQQEADALLADLLGENK